MCEIQNQPFQLPFHASLNVDFQGSRVTSDGGLILVRFYNKRGTAEEWIKEGKQAVKMMVRWRLDCKIAVVNEPVGCILLWLRMPKRKSRFRLSFNSSLKVDFQGSRVTSDGGLLLVRDQGDLRLIREGGPRIVLRNDEVEIGNSGSKEAKMAKRIFVGLLVTLLMSAVAVQAQAPAGPPKPGPEHARLGVFVGKWSGSGDMKPGPWGPGGKTTWTETCEWFTGGFSVVCHSDWKGPMGDSKALFILGYNAEEKKYVYFGVESTMSNLETSKGTVQGNTWNWVGEGKMGGKMVKSKFTIIEQSKDTHTFKGESSVDGGPWSVTMEGKSTRAK